MEATELRIGNFVQEADSKDKRPGMVWQHTLDKITLRMEHSTLELKADKRVNAYTLIEPIPLTEEWLINLGFKKDTGRCYRIHFGRWVPLRLQSSRNGIEWIDVKTNARPRYVHQIQNLYKALTGEELVSKK